jgi:putative methylase
MYKKQVEIVLSQLKESPYPKVGLEQYTIPSSLAAEILNLAWLNGDIEGKFVVDLGCGSGRLAIGSALLGAKKVIGIDVDEEILKIAEENVKIAENLTGKKIQKKIKFIKKDVSEWKKDVDTVIQNPPFGIQVLHADRPFLKKALECGRRVYSLHRSYRKTRKFLKKFIEQNGGRVEKIIRFKFRIPYMFKFHKKPSVEYDVDLFIISR